MIKEGLPIDKAEALLKGAGVEVPPSAPVSHPRAGADLPDFTRANKKRTHIAKMLHEQQTKASRFADQAFEAQLKCDALEQELIEADAELTSVMDQQAASISVPIASKRAEDHPLLRDMIDNHATVFMQRTDASDEAKSDVMTMIFNMVSLFNSDLAQRVSLGTVFPDAEAADVDALELVDYTPGEAASSSLRATPKTAPSPGPGFPRPDMNRLKEISNKSKNKPQAPRPNKVKGKFNKTTSATQQSEGDDEFDEDPMGHGLAFGS